jgi:hypothetical protein
MAKCDQDLDLDPYKSTLVWLPGSGSVLRYPKHRFSRKLFGFFILHFYDFCIPFYVRSGSKSGTGMHYGSSSATLDFIPIYSSSSCRSFCRLNSVVLKPLPIPRCPRLLRKILFHFSYDEVVFANVCSCLCFP